MRGKNGNHPKVNNLHRKREETRRKRRRELLLITTPTTNTVLAPEVWSPNGLLVSSRRRFWNDPCRGHLTFLEAKTLKPKIEKLCS